ncbi:MAG: helix-turn-helix domain-containing protein [Sphingomonadales bacterium]|nr:helix-turn-helix domain-containing protein [Sphingomonadales bacterium]
MTTKTRKSRIVGVSLAKSRRRNSATDWARVDALTDTDIAKAIAADQDAAPDMSLALRRGYKYLPKGYPDDMGPDVKAIRKRLGLSQGAFAKRFGLPVATIRNWEQGRTVPDRPAQVLLRVIAAAPKTVQKAVEAA